MNIHQFLNLIGKKKQTIASMLIVFLSIAIIFSAVTPFKYDSNMKLLTIISFRQDIDPYTASRSNEYLSNLLANIVSSGSFFDKIEASGFNIDKNYFSGNEKQQMKKWNKTVKAKSIADTGMIAVDVCHANRAQAEEIARAVAYTLQTTNSQYHGFGNNVEIKIINGPITSNYPVMPNVPLNLGLAIAFAIIFFLCYIYLFPEEKYDLRLWPKKKERAFKEIEFDDVGMVENYTHPTFTPVLSEKEEVVNYSQENNYQDQNFQNNGSMENILKK
jgi:capsular polysaccharide biosynthesis protein